MPEAQTMNDKAKPGVPADHPHWVDFERGFSNGLTGAVVTCLCGRIFYNPGNGWDWDEGEIERLEADPNATGVDWSCGQVWFEGKTYAMDCDCWHKRARAIVDWVLAHDQQIADFLNNVKATKTAEANRVDTVQT